MNEQRAVRSQVNAANGVRKELRMKQLITRDLLKQLIPVAVVATVAAVLLVAPALAAKHHADPWVSVSPSAPLVGDNLVFSGCGYVASSNVSVVVSSPFAASFTGASTDSTGCFSTSSWGYTALMAGSYTVQVYQDTDHHNPSGSLTFSVS
jgi:hypothetical protein